MDMQCDFHLVALYFGVCVFVWVLGGAVMGGVVEKRGKAGRGVSQL